jgi:glucan phosphoethanolaminetransferase (alkaline phosphatase superfamily)
MSKKSRLQKQKEKQTEMKRLADLEELEEREEAKYKESKAARKLRKKARREKKRKGGGVLIFIFKLLMVAAFLWSGFFYGGVTIVGAMTSVAEFIPKRIAVIMIIADVVIAVGLVLAFLGKNKIQALFCIPGSAAFFYAGLKVVLDIQERMENVYVDSDLENMDKTYMLYYFPILAITLFSAIILVIAIVRLIKQKRRQKVERDNAPVASIVEGD